VFPNVIGTSILNSYAVSTN